MPIIYSYPKVVTLLSSDLLIGTRFENEDNGSARTISFTAEALGSYVTDNYANTLDQVLDAGNESLLDAKIGDLYLWDITNDTYSKITSDKDRINFYGIDNDYYGYIGRDSLRLVNVSNTLGFSIRKPTTVTAERTATFQDASGTVAYLSNISNYGLATQLANSTPVSGTTTPGVLNGSSYSGSLSIPANGFTVGDTFDLNMMGHIACINGTTLTITIETVSGVVLATTGAMSMNITTDKHWVLNTTFVIRAIGAAGTARIMTAGLFSANRNSGNNAETFNFVSENTTTFDTTVANELVVKATWGSTSGTNSIYSNVLTLNKVY
jgi:hypothetical protein